VTTADKADRRFGSSRRPFAARWGWAIASGLAASLLLVLFGSQWWPPVAQVGTPVVQNLDQADSPSQVAQPDSIAAARLEAEAAGVEHLEALVSGLELSRLEQRRDQLLRAVAASAQPLERREAVALALVTGCESARDLGFSGKLVEADLSRVIELLPDTAGSKRASSLLNVLSGDEVQPPST
jgi:hypothetical protein